MDKLQSRSVVRRIVEQGGEFMVSFHTHNGYFFVAPSPDAPALKERLWKSQREQEEITFTFDRNLRILEIYDLA